MEAILEARDIRMIYADGVVANRGVSLRWSEHHPRGGGRERRRQIHPDEDPVRHAAAAGGGNPLQGPKGATWSSHEAIRLGIGMVHQHLMLAPELSVAENMVLGVEPAGGGCSWIPAGRRRSPPGYPQEYGLAVPADKKIKDLPIGVRQRVEILKALYRNAELLILDEPTSVLTPQEAEGLFTTLQELKEHGKTIIFISHKLKEVKRIADRVTIMRDARVITTRDAGELVLQCDELARMDYDFLFDKARHLLAIGYNVAERRRDPSYYDLLASEARLVSFVAIAQGQLPQEHWFALGRLLTTPRRRAGAAVVERLDVRVPDAAAGDADYDNTLLDQTYRAAVERQIEYGRQRGVPWGISESRLQHGRCAA